jgi:hypothetical protein
MDCEEVRDMGMALIPVIRIELRQGGGPDVNQEIEAGYLERRFASAGISTAIQPSEQDDDHIVIQVQFNQPCQYRSTKERDN